MTCHNGKRSGRTNDYATACWRAESLVGQGRRHFIAQSRFAYGREIIKGILDAWTIPSHRYPCGPCRPCHGTTNWADQLMELVQGDHGSEGRNLDDLMALWLRVAASQRILFRSYQHIVFWKSIFNP